MGVGGTHEFVLCLARGGDPGCSWVPLACRRWVYEGSGLRWGKNSPERGDAGAVMTVSYPFPVKGLGNAAFSYPLFCSTLVLGD